MGRLQVMAEDCIYKETDWHLKEQCINGLKDNGMVTEIIGELAATN